MGAQEDVRVRDPLAQAEELLPELASRGELCSHDVIGPEPGDGIDDLRRLARMPAQLPEPGVCATDLRGREALGRHQRHRERGLKREFLRDALRHRKDRDQLEPPRQVRDRLEMGRAFARPLTGSVPVRNGARTQSRLGVVMGEKVGATLREAGEPLLQNLRDGFVPAGPTLPSEAIDTRPPGSTRA